MSNQWFLTEFHRLHLGSNHVCFSMDNAGVSSVCVLVMVPFVHFFNKKLTGQQVYLKPSDLEKV